MRRTTREDYERRLLRAEQAIETRLDEDVAPAEIARVAGMSVHHFHRVFRGMRGESVMGFARRLRLERAARQLRTSPRKLIDVAVDAGYGSHEAFTRAFSELFGVPPSEYRAAAEPPSPLPSRCAPASAPADVDVRVEPERAMLCMRHIGPYRTVSETWQRFVAWYAPAFGPPADQFALVPDDPQVTAEERLRYDACLPAPEGVTRGDLPPGPVTLGTLPAGRYAVTTHCGPYDGLADSYLALIGAWFPRSGYAMAAEPVVERYLNSPPETAPEALRTEIRVRIEDRGWLT